MLRSQQRIVGLIVSVVVVAGLMVFFGWIFPTSYGATDTRLVAQALYIGIAAMGLNILTGYNGQVSIGHGAFFGVGAYTTALLMDHQYTWLGITFGHMSFLATLLPSRGRDVRDRCARRLPGPAGEGPVPRARDAWAWR